MKEDTAQCISACLNTSKGSHVFYRNFGLTCVDDTNVPMRKDILIQLSTYYPEVTLNGVTITQADSNGHFSYIVDVNE